MPPAKPHPAPDLFETSPIFSGEVTAREAAVFRTPYTYNLNEKCSADYSITPEGVSMTSQEFKAECDINNILKKYPDGLNIPSRTPREPMFDDFTQMPDLQEAFAVIQLAERDFIQNCPAILRKRFNNDPLEFVNYLNNPENYDEAVKLGLITAKGSPSVVTPPAPTTQARNSTPLDVTVPGDTDRS